MNKWNHSFMLMAINFWWKKSRFFSVHMLNACETQKNVQTMSKRESEQSFKKSGWMMYICLMHFTTTTKYVLEKNLFSHAINARCWNLPLPSPRTFIHSHCFSIYYCKMQIYLYNSESLYCLGYINLRFCFFFCVLLLLLLAWTLSSWLGFIVPYCVCLSADDSFQRLLIVS